MTISFEQVQTQLAQLLDKVATGEELIITRDGRPVARLIPEPGSAPAKNGSGSSVRMLGTARGLIRIADNFDAPMDEFREYTE